MEKVILLYLPAGAWIVQSINLVTSHGDKVFLALAVNQGYIRLRKPVCLV